jgi:outer membrane protein TolC
MRRIGLVVGACGAALVVTGPAGAQAPPRAPLVLTLADAVARAVAASAEIRQVQQGVAAAEAKKDQADAGRFPQLTFTSVVGPSARARGTVVGSPDNVNEPTVDHVFTRQDLRLVQPLYTFGKLSNLREAAAQGVQVERARVDEKRADVVLRVKEAYFGLLLARELGGLLADIQDQLGKALAKVERQLAAGAPGADEVDLYKLRTFAGELRKNLGEVERGRELALSGLRTLLDLPADQAIEPAAKGLEPDPRAPGPEAGEVAEALRRRPEMAQVAAGLRATEALVEAERSHYYPQVFAAVEGALARAGNRTFQRNPFVHDPVNTHYAVPVVGLKLDLDFGITAAKVRAAMAEHRKLQETKVVAERGIPFQVRKALLEAAEARRSIAATDEAYTNAKKWLVAAVANFDLGVGEAKDVADAMVAFARLRADNYRAIYNFNLALANLDHATGRDARESR